jgi:ribosomal protein L11 methyltransferase
LNVTVTVLTVPVGDVELGSDRLWTVGAFAIEERPVGDDRVELRANLGDAVDVGRMGELPPAWTLHLEQVDTTPTETWRQHVQAIAVADDLVLRPAWLPARAVVGVVEVSIEPAATFGLGDHPTTRLSAAAVWRTVSEGDRLLDVGCGSGVLSIVGALAGARAVVAIDVSAAAPPAVRDNALANGVWDRIDASTTPLDQVDGEFEVVVANILAPDLVGLADDLRRVTADGGTLIVSGVLADHHQHVLDALRPMAVVRTDVLDGWAAVTLRH